MARFTFYTEDNAPCGVCNKTIRQSNAPENRTLYDKDREQWLNVQCCNGCLLQLKENAEAERKAKLQSVPDISPLQKLVVAESADPFTTIARDIEENPEYYLELAARIIEKKKADEAAKTKSVGAKKSPAKKRKAKPKRKPARKSAS